jgi:hypothetical protein
MVMLCALNPAVVCYNSIVLNVIWKMFIRQQETYLTENMIIRGSVPL